MKKTGQLPICKYFQCIKRQSTPGKKEENCAARLRVEKFDEGENNMIVVPRGQAHNHELSSSDSIKKEINEELRILVKEFPKMKTEHIIKSVINTNENFKNFYEQNSKKILSSMRKAIQRARPSKATETLNSDDSD